MIDLRTLSDLSLHELVKKEMLEAFGPPPAEGPYVSIEAAVGAWMALLNMVQVGWHHPGARMMPSGKIARELCQQILQHLFADMPAVYEMYRRGWEVPKDAHQH